MNALTQIELCGQRAGSQRVWMGIDSEHPTSEEREGGKYLCIKAHALDSTAKHVHERLVLLFTSSQGVFVAYSSDTDGAWQL